MVASVVDLFCGVGGMTYGFLKEKFHVSAGIDVDPTCRYAFEHNNNAPFINTDVRRLTPSKLATLFPPGGLQVLVGCAPCQPFSLYTNREKPDGQWRLLRTFAKLATTILPDVVSMENVPRLARHKVFDEFVRSLERAGYHVSYYIANGPDYGIPQRRRRLVLFGSAYGPIQLVPPTHNPGTGPNVRDAIGKLEPLGAGEASRRDRLHRVRGLSPLNQRRLLATREGGGWKDWEDSLRLACHLDEKGKSFGSVYGRMRWDQPAPVITTQFIGLGNGRFGHPEQNRAISLREAAILQTFPRRYAFVPPDEPVALSRVAKHIGNAVPVRLGRIVARSIRRHFQEYELVD